jgi:hypothetical protein
MVADAKTGVDAAGTTPEPRGEKDDVLNRGCGASALLRPDRRRRSNPSVDGRVRLKAELVVLPAARPAWGRRSGVCRTRYLCRLAPPSGCEPELCAPRPRFARRLR